MKNSHLSANTADLQGGGVIHTRGDSLDVDDTVFESNAGGGGGGALAIASTSKGDR